MIAIICSLAPMTRPVQRLHALLRSEDLYRVDPTSHSQAERKVHSAMSQTSLLLLSQNIRKYLSPVCIWMIQKAMKTQVPSVILPASQFPITGRQADHS